MNKNSEYWLMFGHMMDACNQFWGSPQTPGIIKKCAEIAIELMRHKGHFTQCNGEDWLGKSVKVQRRRNIDGTFDVPKNAGGGKKEQSDDPIETAYMGEHFNIEPEEPIIEKKPLSKKEQEFYDYYVAHPGASKPEFQRELMISQAMYFFLKGQCRKKGWISSNGEIVGLKIKEN